MGNPSHRRLRWGPRRFPLRRSLLLLPNLITLSSVFCGVTSIVLAGAAQSPDDYQRAALLIVFALVFDMLDGRVARLTKTQSSFGLQLDSLADVISFGVAPASLAYPLCLRSFGLAGLLVSFAFVACGAIRLARFNVLSLAPSGAPAKPSKYIVGLPIPGAAGILVSAVLAGESLRRAFGQPLYAEGMLALTLGLAALMVSTIRFRSFKDLRLTLRTILIAGFAVGSSAVIFTQLEPAFVLLWLLGLYILIGIVEWLRSLLGRWLLRPARHDSPPPPGPLT